MCGIFGVWNRDNEAIDLRIVQQAVTSIRHRGPDDEGYVLFNIRSRNSAACSGVDTDSRLVLPHLFSQPGDAWDLAFGFRRLSILDLSTAGHQPMSSPDGRYWIVFNGEVYNYIELREELNKKGIPFGADPIQKLFSLHTTAGVKGHLNDLLECSLLPFWIAKLVGFSWRAIFLASNLFIIFKWVAGLLLLQKLRNC